MEIPANATVIESRSATTWKGDDGIIYSIGKPDISQNEQDALENLSVIKKLSEGLPTPQICDINNVRFVSREAKDIYGSNEYASLVSAMALIVESTYSKVNANYMEQIVKPAYPSETFNSIDEARAWVLETVSSTAD